MIFGLYFGSKEDKEVLLNKEKTSPDLNSSIDKGGNVEESSSVLKVPKEGLAALMGKDASALKAELGEPSRTEPSYYDYEWWIYNSSLKTYVQAGIENGKIVSIYAIGSDSNVAPFKIGQSVEEIYSSAFIDTSISLDYDNNSYRFELSEEDMNTRPLVKIGNYFAQLYIDRFTGTLSSVRFLDGKTLIKHRPYELIYRGELIESVPVAENAMEKVERGTERQIFDITNVIRARHDLNPVKWDEKTAQAAFAHSKDMFESGEFSHTSKKFGDLFDRLKAADVFYQMAGENIAANYIDGPSVVEGWLNSKAHRETLLNKEFTHLGVGVYQKQYTQNFIQKWEE